MTTTITETYARGAVTFMGLELAVGPGALVPRAETELLARTAIGEMEAMGLTAPRIIDMCCGVGNIACALAARFPQARIWASDLTTACVKLAQENVHRLGLGARVEVAQGDLFAGLNGRGLEGAIDMVVCNPPYISEKRLESESAALLEHEPREAFDGGPYGLSIHQRVIKECLVFLKPGGPLLFEIGLGQDKQVKLLFGRGRAFEEAGFACDAGGQPRVAYARRKTA